MANFVVTHRKRMRDGFTFVSGDLRTLIKQVRKAAGGKDIWLVGGAILNGAFHDAGLINRTVITTVPVFSATASRSSRAAAGFGRRGSWRGGRGKTASFSRRTRRTAEDIRRALRAL
jgi:dihydrofolate reductase